MEDELKKNMVKIRITTKKNKFVDQFNIESNRFEQFLEKNCQTFIEQGYIIIASVFQGWAQRYNSVAELKQLRAQELCL